MVDLSKLSELVSQYLPRDVPLDVNNVVGLLAQNSDQRALLRELTEEEFKEYLILTTSPGAQQAVTQLAIQDHHNPEFNPLITTPTKSSPSFLKGILFIRGLRARSKHFFRSLNQRLHAHAIPKVIEGREEPSPTLRKFETSGMPRQAWLKAKKSAAEAKKNAGVKDWASMPTLERPIPHMQSPSLPKSAVVLLAALGVIGLYMCFKPSKATGTENTDKNTPSPFSNGAELFMDTTKPITQLAWWMMENAVRA